MFNSIAVWHPVHLCGFIFIGISPYPLNNRCFSCLLVPPEGVHSTISNIVGTADIKICGLGGRNSRSERRNMRTIFAEYNPQRNSIDVYTSAGYMLRIDCWEAEKDL